MATGNYNMSNQAMEDNSNSFLEPNQQFNDVSLSKEKQSDSSSESDSDLSSILSSSEDENEASIAKPIKSKIDNE
jgi:hypothetical protein